MEGERQTETERWTDRGGANPLSLLIGYHFSMQHIVAVPGAILRPHSDPGVRVKELPAAGQERTLGALSPTRKDPCSPCCQPRQIGETKR